MNTTHGWRLSLGGLATVLMVGWCFPAGVAGVAVSFVPADTSLATGAQSEMAVVLTQSTVIRSFEVRVSYDPGVLDSMSGSTGSLFSGIPCFVMDGFEDSTPGTFHAYAVVIGSACSASGPGELFRWTFRAAHAGHTTVAATTATLYDPGGYPIAGVTVEPVGIGVRDRVEASGANTWGAVKSLYR